MKRLIGAAVLLGALTASARAHFVYIIPAEGKRMAQVVFSDSLKPDRAELLAKIAHTQFLVDAPGKAKKLEAKKGKNALVLAPPGKNPVWVAGTCEYGVVDKGKQPFLLNYHARALVGTRPANWPSKDYLARRVGNPPLDVVLIEKGENFWLVRVYFRGKPLSGAQVALHVPGSDEAVEKKTDEDGQVKLLTPKEPGLYGVRVGHVEKKQGTHKGKDYKEVRHYTTLVFLTPLAGSSRATGRHISVAADRVEKPAANPEATRLLADARAARASWEGFPGFTANVKVNADGKVTTGKVAVSSSGKVTLDLDGPQKEWARAMLSSIAGHRMEGSVSETPCAFADDVVDHPLGRAIRVLNDEYHSSYRIRDRQVIEVNRRMGDVRFTITVLENRLNEEKKYLPAHYVVSTWDGKTRGLKRSVTHHNTWLRLGKYDLPARAVVVTASDGKLTTQTIELTGHRLNGK